MRINALVAPAPRLAGEVPMRTLILYYSITGHSRRIAEGLAGRLDARLDEITCRAYGKGLGPLRQAFDVLRGGSPPIEVPDTVGQDWDLVVVGGPVWGARPAPPVRSYLRRHARRHASLALFVSCKGTSPAYPPERAMAEMTALAPRAPRASWIFTEALIDGPDFAAALAGFADALRGQA